MTRWMIVTAVVVVVLAFLLSAWIVSDLRGLLDCMAANAGDDTLVRLAECS